MSTTTLTGVVTNQGRAMLAKSFGNVGGFPMCRAYNFIFGEGGFISTGSGTIPKDPDPSLVDIEATGQPGSARISKQLTAADVQFIAPSTIELRCRLNPNEGNDDGNGVPPTFFELGIFDDNNHLIAYSTFDAQTKTSTKSLVVFMQVFF